MLAFRCFSSDGRTIQVLNRDKLLTYRGAKELRVLAFAVVNELSSYCLEASNGYIELKQYAWAYVAVMALGAERMNNSDCYSKLYSAISELGLPTAVDEIRNEAN